MRIILVVFSTASPVAELPTWRIDAARSDKWNKRLSIIEALIYAALIYAALAANLVLLHF